MQNQFFFHFVGLSLVVSSLGSTLQKPRMNRGSRIVNGMEVAHNRFPFLVSIQFRDNDHDEWLTTCGGSIVNSVTVLTACHCATADEKIHGNIKYIVHPDKRRIVAGTANWKKNSTTKQIARVGKIVTHPKCQHFYVLDRPFVNDVALYFLKDPLLYTHEVQPMKLPRSLDILASTKFLELLKFRGERCTTVGWGRTLEDDWAQSEKLIGAEVEVLRADECRRRFCKMIGEHCKTDFDGLAQLCVASPVASDCYGDSGGPLVCKGFVVGTVSYGHRCLPNLPTVFQGLQPILEVLTINKLKIDHFGFGRHEVKAEFEDQTRTVPVAETIARELHQIRELLEELTDKKYWEGTE